MHNFYAGPSLINEEVLNQTIKQISKQENAISVLEKSHRTKQFGEIMEETISLTKEILGLGNEFEVMYLQGGGRQQFYQIPFNCAEMFKTTYFIETGEWATQAHHEASFFGKAEILASSRNEGFREIPEIPEIPEDASYTYITTNNTIYGTQCKGVPNVKSPLVADMTSDLFTRELDFSQFDLFFSGTQKNIGTAGACMVAVKPELLKKERGSLPTMIDYRTHIDKKSLYNTPPVFAIVMALNTLKWIKQQGGLAHLEQLNQQKSTILYNELERNGLFKLYANKKDRSVINVVFNGLNQQIEEEFLNFAKENQIEGIRGHRAIGGFRASLYNAQPLNSVQVLVNVLKEFERLKG